MANLAEFAILCDKHQQPAILFLISENLRFRDRIVCQQCNEENPSDQKFVLWNSLKKFIADDQNSIEEQFILVKDQVKDYLMKLHHNLDILRTQLVLYLDQKIGHIINWIECTQSTICPIELKAEMVIEKRYCRQNYMIGKIHQVFSEQSKVYMNKLHQMENSIKEIEKQKYVVGQSLRATLQFIKNEFKNEGIADQPTSPTQRSKYQKIAYATNQTEVCRAIAFNTEGTLMAAACGQAIKIWEFQQGQLKKCLHILTGHTNAVTCLVYSKKINWFASGGLDYNIRCWQQLDDTGWAASNPQPAHKNYIQVLTLNQQEDELYSASYDSTIKVWKVNIHNNLINFHQSLERHISIIYAVSVNEQGNYLASCCKNRQILIWQNIKGVWQFAQQVIQSIQDYGYRLCFINNTTFVWLSQSRGSTFIFTKKDGSFAEETDQTVKLQKETQQCYDLSPSVFISQKRMLVQKHQNYIQIIKQAENNQFYLDFVIDCCFKFYYQGITIDGQYIVIWNSQTSQFNVYRILE